MDVPEKRPGIDSGNRPGIDSRMYRNRPGIDSRMYRNRPGIDSRNRPGIGSRNRPGIGSRMHSKQTCVVSRVPLEGAVCKGPGSGHTAP